MRVKSLLDALRDDRSQVRLDIAALELASIEFPGLDFEAFTFRLDSLAEQIDATLTRGASGLDFIKAANELLFDVMQFRGNAEEYYDPRNSCLNSVLIRRLGIPISLSLVYMEVARRLILSFSDLCALAKDAANVDLRSNPALLGPVTKRQLLVRMLSNLKAIYMRGEAFDKARQVLDLLIEAMPDYAEEYRHRGLVHLRQLNHRAAKADLETYLKLQPDSPEREGVEKQLVLIERWKAGLN